jgi:glycosyltransferase involved in cell wall biosynthesis
MTAPKHHKLFWGSSYDRGIQYLLYMWPDIKMKYPDAELHVCYGWNLFVVANQHNPERMEWKKSIEVLMQQPGITHHGRVGKEDLAQIRQSCGIWAYPTDFREISCINALDCAKDGVVPVVIGLAALKETAKEGIVVDGDIRDEKIQQKYLKELLDLMGDKKRWEKLSKECKKFIGDLSWDKISDKWLDYFKKPISTPKVSVITITIREGWWRIMAENLSKQTYKNFEWIIVDDYKEDRRKISEKYAKKYNLDIKYIRGDKGLGKYDKKCGLVRANNIAWKASEGEMTIWLQDFILIPETGVESIVDIYRHNPDALIAPVDIYYDVKKADTKNQEDWWEGLKDAWNHFLPIITEETWRNVRVKNLGIYETENPFDFEMDYCAIPKKILDELNGFWEFMDEGLGYDNTEIAYRALKLGYRIIIDDTNIAKCINLWPIIGGTSQNIISRERMLNPPRWQWLKLMTDEGRMPLRRDEKVDKATTLPFEVPKEVKDNDCSKWIADHTEEIVRGWLKDAV